MGAEAVAEKALEIMRERRALYQKTPANKDMYIRIIMIIFPNGIPGEYKAMMRYKYISYIIEKLCRYIQACPHEDSLIDIGNYSFMLAAFDREQAEKEPGYEASFRSNI